MKRIVPLAALAGVVVAVITAVAGQLDSDPTLDPVRLTVGEYAALAPGGATETALAVLGLASLALLAGLRGAGAPVRGWPERLLLVWSGALVLTALLPAAAPGEALDLTALAHRAASTAAFLSLPAAAGLLAPRLAADERWRGAARPLEWLALAGGLGLAAITYVALPGDRIMIGLVERLLLGVEAAVIVLLAVHLVRLAWPRPAAIRVALGPVRSVKSRVITL